ncbi:M23 family metallopeptidase [Phenylobacterium immobile]|uniref:M23 family metallopeptidase n=1 Tax=Phenylobacterium immobile TaxID=21 RepID=UPI000B87E7FA|nr:M23 family metallopeptidase [Phenylobacterium immobile]
MRSLAPFSFRVAILASLPLFATPAAAQIARPSLESPIACVVGRTCEIQNYVDRDPGPGARDYRCAARTYDAHNGVDIRLPDLAAMTRGVAVLAAAPGRVVRLRDGEPDRSVRDAPFAPGRDCGNAVAIDHGGGWETMSCHLKRGSLKVKVGDQVKAGQPIAAVGLSGNTEYPHLHLTVFRNRVAVDPFAPDSGRGTCAASGALWSPAAGGALTYKAGAVLNTGFADGPVDFRKIDAGVTRPGPPSKAIVAYARAINLEAGDQTRVTLTGPQGLTKANNGIVPRAQAQNLLFTGLPRPVNGWPAGRYVGRFQVTRAGRTVLDQRFEMALPASR